jgi:hypothetical protein
MVGATDTHAMQKFLLQLRWTHWCVAGTPR